MSLTPEERRRLLSQLPALDEQDADTHEDHLRAPDPQPDPPADVPTTDEKDEEPLYAAPVPQAVEPETPPALQDDTPHEEEKQPDRIYLRQQERMRKRRVSSRRNRMLVAAISTLVLFLAALIIFIFIKIDNDNKGRTAAIENLDQAIDLVTRADEVVIPLDTAVFAEVGSAEHEVAVQLLADTTTTDAALDSAESHTREALSLSQHLSVEERQVASALMESIEGRREMLSVGRVLVATDEAASQARDTLNTAYERLLAADKSIREGATLAATVHEGDEIDLEVAAQVVEYDREALAALQEVQALATTASEQFSQLDVTSLETYVEKRIQAVSLLISADTAVHEEDLDKATEEIEAYNLLDAEVVELAKALPRDASSFVADAYRTLTEAQRSAYGEARERASGGDAVIRDFQAGSMGEGVTTGTQSASPASTTTDATGTAPDPEAQGTGTATPAE